MNIISRQPEGDAIVDGRHVFLAITFPDALLTLAGSARGRLVKEGPRLKMVSALQPREITQ